MEGNILPNALGYRDASNISNVSPVTQQESMGVLAMFGLVEDAAQWPDVEVTIVGLEAGDVKGGAA